MQKSGWNAEKNDPALLRMGPFFGRTLWNSLNWIKMTSIMDSSWSSEGTKRSVHCFIFFLNSTFRLRTPSNRWHQKPRHKCQHIGVCGAVSSYSGALSHYGAIRARFLNAKSLKRHANTSMKPQNDAGEKKKCIQDRCFYECVLPGNQTRDLWPARAWWAAEPKQEENMRRTSDFCNIPAGKTCICMKSD